MEEAPHIPNLSFLTSQIDGGPITMFGWLSLLILVIMGCVLLLVPPRSGRRRSLVDLFAACFHIQILVFLLCVPMLLTFAAYMPGGSPQAVVRVFVRDMQLAGISVLIDFTIGGSLLLLVSLRHRKTPAIEWAPALSILISIISLTAAWHCKVAGSVWLSGWMMTAE